MLVWSPLTKVMDNDPEGEAGQLAVVTDAVAALLVWF